MKIEVHESALDGIKAMGQRDKERIETLTNGLAELHRAISAYWANDSGKNWDALSNAHDKAGKLLRANHDSQTIAEKAK